MESPAEFSQDYATARDRFRQAANDLGWRLESHPIGREAPGGEPLTIDAGLSPGGDPQRLVLVTSGLHGVEGFFGSAVQLALLNRWRDSDSEPASGPRFVFAHGLNPYGFAWLRRFDERNVDPNRNFLPDSESYSGSPPGYAALDPLLNPPRPPARLSTFPLKAAGVILRQGMSRVRGAVAGGQYDFPRGLFYGGAEPTTTHRILAEQLPRWIDSASAVVHLDFHTGLGARAAHKLLIDYPLNSRQRRQLTDWYGPDAFEESAGSSIAYHARGGFGQWCVSRGFAGEYLYACAEFGTYGPLRVLAGLRAENRAHHWSPPGSLAIARTRRRLKELFCPASASWRRQVLRDGVGLVERAAEGLGSETLS